MLIKPFLKFITENNHEQIKIRGEYWIQNGQVDFADGDVGDKGHEAIAHDHIVYQHIDSVVKMAEELGIESESFKRLSRGDDNYLLPDVLGQIEDHLIESGKSREEAVKEMREFLGIDEEGFSILGDGGDPGFYVMMHDGWIAIRSNNIELYGYDEQKRKSLFRGINEILYDEFDSEFEEVPPEQIEFSLFDVKTKKSSEITLADIMNPQPTFRTNQPSQNTYNKALPMPVLPDTTENTPRLKTAKDLDATKNLNRNVGGIPGHQIWRGTSESVLPFADWIKSR
jgi:hypothetical protein